MKKILFIPVTVLIVMSLFSCADPCETYTVEPFEATVTAESGEAVLTGKLKYASPTAISLTVSDPVNIKGLTFAVQDGSDYIMIGTMKSASVPLSTFPYENNVIENLFKALQALQNGLNAPKNGTAKINYDYDYGKCMISFNSETQRVERIDAGKFKYTFLYD